MNASHATLIATFLLAAYPAVGADPGGYGKRPDGVTVGPRLSLLSFPAPGIGVEAKVADLVGASFDYGLIPQVSLEGAKVDLTTWRAGAKLYPLRGRFWLGAAYGSRTFTARKTVTSGGVSESGKLEVTSSFLAPELGWLFVRPNGFFVGIDLGWEFVLHSSRRLTATTALPDTDRKDLQDLGRRIGKAGLPELGLLRVGWFL